MSHTSTTEDLPGVTGTVVIGGGQAGLAAGYHLARAGQDFVILDAHPRVGDAWRNRWDSLRLFTPAKYDGLPGMAFPARSFHYPTKDEVADYLEAYAEHFELPVRTGVRVDHLGKDGDGFAVTASGHTIRTDHVIVATGFDNEPKVPSFAEQLDDGIIQLHSKEYRRPSQLQEGDALVVGAGNSGAEIAVELAAAGHRTWLSGRDPGQEPAKAGSVPGRLLAPLIWFAATHVMRVDRAIGRKVRAEFLEPPRGIPRARVNRKDISEAGIEWVPRTAGVRDGRPVLEDERVLDVTNVVWCTGFERGYDWLDLEVPMQHGIPIHDRGVVPTEPGLYFLGLYFQYSMSSPLVGGVGRDAEYIVDHLVSAGRRDRRATGRRGG